MLIQLLLEWFKCISLDKWICLQEVPLSWLFLFLFSTSPMDKVKIILKYLIPAFNCGAVFTWDAEPVSKVLRRFLVDVYELLGLSQHNFFFFLITASLPGGSLNMCSLVFATNRPFL